jgi:hypothetical protein
MTPEFRDRRFAVLRRKDVIAVEARFQMAQEARIVFDDQEFTIEFAHSLRNSATFQRGCRGPASQHHL